MSDFYVILFLSNKRWVLGGRWGGGWGRREGGGEVGLESLDFDLLFPVGGWGSGRAAGIGSEVFITTLEGVENQIN